MGPFQPTTWMTTPLGSRTWKARSPHSSTTSGIVMATPSPCKRASSPSRSATVKARISPVASTSRWSSAGWRSRGAGRHTLDGADAPTRGPRRTLTVDAVVAAAVALADEQGLDAETMGALAQRLRTVAMSLYTYVPGCAELVDLMVGTLYAAMPPDSGENRPWLQRVHAIAEDNRDLYRAHPWAARVSTLRPSLGPGPMAEHERELAAFTGSGLEDLGTDDALTWLLTFVRANAVDAADARQASGDDQQWWQAAGPLLARVLDQSAYPLATRIGTAGAAHDSAHDPAHAYAFGIDRVIAAIARLAAT